MFVRHRSRPGRVQYIDHGSFRPKDPQIPLVTLLALHLFEYQPTCLVRIPQRLRNILGYQHLVERLEQRAKTFQPTGHRALGNVEIQCLAKLRQKPIGRALVEEFVQQYCDPGQQMQ